MLDDRTIIRWIGVMSDPNLGHAEPELFSIRADAMAVLEARFRSEGEMSMPTRNLEGKLVYAAWPALTPEVTIGLHRIPGDPRLGDVIRNGIGEFDPSRDPEWIVVLAHRRRATLRRLDEHVRIRGEQKRREVRPLSLIVQHNLDR